MKKTRQEWKTKNFVSLPPRWMAEFKGEDGSMFAIPVPGVLIEEGEDGELRAMAAEFFGAELLPIDDPGNHLMQIFYEHRNRHRGSNRPSTPTVVQKEVESATSQCDHKCHKTGLNPWIVACPICGCCNPNSDPSVRKPETFDEFLDYVNERER